MFTFSRTRRRWSPETWAVLLLLTSILLACGWIGNSLSWIRQRHQKIGDKSRLWRFPDVNSTAPGGLWLFGEAGYREMTLGRLDGPGGADERTNENLKSCRVLFPESTVHWIDSDGKLR